MIQYHDKTNIHEVDTIFYCSIGFRPHGVYTERPLYCEKYQPTGRATLRSIITADADLNTHIENLSKLRECGFAGKLFVWPWIRPHRLVGPLSEADWRVFCYAEYEVLQSIVGDLDGELLRYPDGCEFITPASLILNPRSDGTHGNETYAQHMVERLADAASVSARDCVS